MTGPCKDGKWIALAHLDPNRCWPNLLHDAPPQDIHIQRIGIF